MFRTKSSKLNEALQLNYVDNLFIRTVQDGTFEEKQFFETQLNSDQLGMIIRVANADPRFETLCLKEEYEALWAPLISDVLSRSTEVHPDCHALFEVPGVRPFDLLRGLYFYLESVSLRPIEGSIGFSELDYLKKSMEYGSIHAMQRYHVHCYEEIKDQPDDAASRFDEMIRNCRSMVGSYGSYAYMMLAEVYYHYTSYLIETGAATRNIETSYFAALRCCDRSADMLNESSFAISNASFGHGLGRSNSFEIDVPRDAKLLIRKTLDPRVYPEEETVDASLNRNL